MNINFLVFSDMNLLDFSGPLEVFVTANRLSEEYGSSEPYNINIFSSNSEPFVMVSGLKIVTNPLPKPDMDVDTLVIPGGFGVHSASQDSELLSWVASHSVNARRVVSICSGAFILAACGLLDNRRAVTHWSVTSEFSHCYPNVKVERDPIFIQDGSVWTSAGVTAGIDLALALVEDDLGHKISLEIAKNLVMFTRRSGGQHQFSSIIKLQSESKVFDKLHSWVYANLHKKLTITALAEYMNMSERNFARVYKLKTGQSPAKSIEKIRLKAAQHLLENTELPLNRIVNECGYNCEATLRRNFINEFGNTPLQYRKLFRLEFPF